MTARAIALLAALVAVILITSPAASAQSVADQYVPQLDKGGAGVDGGEGPEAAGGAPSQPAAETADARAGRLAASESRDEGSAGGTLPGSDVPVTPFVVGLALLILLAVGVRAARPLLAGRS